LNSKISGEDRRAVDLRPWMKDECDMFWREEKKMVELLVELLVDCSYLNRASRPGIAIHRLSTELRK
jgi:hypothetical protein